MDSSNTFNRHDWFKVYWRAIEPVVFPKWLTLPIHYQDKNTEGTWAGITRSETPQFSSKPIEGVGLTLERLGFKPHPKQKEFLESEERHVFYGGGQPSRDYYSLVRGSWDIMENKYEDGQMEQRIDNNFRYHPPSGDQPKRYEIIREQARNFAIKLARLCPQSRELSLAMTDLEDCVMHANAAIARNE